jgi:hypothetical protein
MIRLPHHVLHDQVGLRGEGTCLDLALMMAGVMENLGLQPLIAVVNLAATAKTPAPRDAHPSLHALVGCWDPPKADLESIRQEASKLLDRSIWVDPTGVTLDSGLRRTFAEARGQAEGYLRETELIFALDVAGARDQAIGPLPFAGRPIWSPEADQGLKMTTQLAADNKKQLCSAAILVGLLKAGTPLTTKVIESCIEGDPTAAADTMLAALPAAPPEASHNYGMVLDGARARAKADGSPQVLEVHLLKAVLAAERSQSLFHALRAVNSAVHRLSTALGEIEGDDQFGTSYFRSQVEPREP